jgi:quinol-cytochrome oxidoreductase complex cytochrome b subunit
MNRFKRVFLAAATAALTINLFTGAPLLALWVGSQVQTSSAVSMAGLAVVLAVLIVTVAIIVFLLLHVESAYKAAIGQPQTRRRLPWMRSLRDESEKASRERTPLNGFEKTLVAVVLLALAAFETWFFFFAGSSLPRAP